MKIYRNWEVRGLRRALYYYYYYCCCCCCYCYCYCYDYDYCYSALTACTAFWVGGPFCVDRTRISDVKTNLKLVHDLSVRGCPPKSSNGRLCAQPAAATRPPGRLRLPGQPSEVSQKLPHPLRRFLQNHHIRSGGFQKPQQPLGRYPQNHHIAVMAHGLGTR